MFGRLLIVMLVAVLAWAVFVRPTEGAAPERSYVVQRGDTLWSVAAEHYGGDLRAAVWRLQQRNRLVGGTVRPGERLVLP